MGLIKQGLTAIMLRATEQQKLKKVNKIEDLLERLEVMETKYIKEIENENKN